MKKILFVILLLGLIFVIGCSKPVPKPEPIPLPAIEEEPQVEEVSEEQTPEEIIESIEGKSCSKNDDCGKNIPFEEAFCKGTSEYQNVYRPKCTFKTVGTAEFVCGFEKATVRIGACEAD
ncbi:MAG: hypothetical protein HYS32_04045 [Candidatus Woesearchaeota archaeon]|nr:MAG: hypothetical protein HYS32_04045 [Candidatus Woesearchaeota archaeon]